MLLALLDERPSNGYELMGELARLFAPAYKPSPGSVYPALTALQEERLISRTPAGFTLTAAGRRALRDRSEMLTTVELRTGARLRTDDEIEGALARLTTTARDLASRGADPERVVKVLDEAMQALSQEVRP